MNTENDMLGSGDGGVEISKAAVLRHYGELGKAVESFRAALVSLKEKQRYVYEVSVRWPSKERASYMVLLKALTEDGPQIAFISGGEWMGTFLEAGRLIRAGSLTWHTDTYPPEGYEERLGWMHSNAHIL